MFQPPLFREDRQDVMHDLMLAHPFATLVSSVAGEIFADHIPLVLHPELTTNGTIRGHLAAGNPLNKTDQHPIDTLTIFQGPQAYVSPSWYPSKQEHGKVVPTWNYVVVHARGQLVFQNDPDWLMAHLIELTKRNEKDREMPWNVTDAPTDYTRRMLKGLVGVEIEVTSLTGQWKVSQNKSAQDKQGVAEGLLTENHPQSDVMSQLVKQR